MAASTDAPPIKRRRITPSSSSNNSTATTSALSKPFKSPVKSSSSPCALATPAPLASASAAKSHAADTATLRALHADIDMLSQATRLLSGPPAKNTTTPAGSHTTTATAPPRDDELRVLIATWRRVSRAAAEEIYGVTRDRVNRMGGVAGLREMEARARERRDEWEGGAANADESVDEDEEEEEEGQDDIEVREARRAAREVARETRRERIEEARAEAESAYDAAAKMAMEAEELAKGKKKGWEGPDGNHDDDAFTMDVMLRKLNVDLNVIGFDAAEQRWID